MVTNLKNVSDITTDLSQGAYTGRPKGMMLSTPDAKQQSELRENGYATYQFPGAKDSSGNDGSTVYLQPDKTGVMSNNDTGFQSYLVTNQSDPHQSTQVYFVVRGSDGMTVNNPDWYQNDVPFATNHIVTPQSVDAAKAMTEQIRNLPPGINMNVTGHSLGTIDTVQALAQLSPRDIGRIGNVTLYDGPDVSASIQAMGKQARENIAQLNNRITYYVNAFDVVSMLNRNGNHSEIGHVVYFVPKNYNSTFYTQDSAHDFGEFQMKDGKPIPANRKDNPDIFAYADMLSSFENKAIGTIQKIIPEAVDTGSLYRVLMATFSNKDITKRINHDLKDGNYADLAKYFTTLFAQAGINIDYVTLVENIPNLMSIYQEYSNLSEMYPPKINSLQNQLRGSGLSSSKRISLQKELVGEVAKAGDAAGAEYFNQIRTLVSTAKQEVEDKINEALKSAQSIVTYLSYTEVKELFANSTIENFWDSNQEAEDKDAGAKYQDELNKFGNALNLVSNDLENFDKRTSKNFFIDYVDMNSKLN